LVLKRRRHARGKLALEPIGAGIQACRSGPLTYVVASRGAEPRFSACGEAPQWRNRAAEAKWIPAFAGMTIA